MFGKRTLHRCCEYIPLIPRLQNIRRVAPPRIRIIKSRPVVPPNRPHRPGPPFGALQERQSARPDIKVAATTGCRTLRKPDVVATTGCRRLRKPDVVATTGRRTLRKPDVVATTGRRRLRKPDVAATTGCRRLRKSDGAATTGCRRLRKPDVVATTGCRRLRKPDVVTTKRSLSALSQKRPLKARQNAPSPPITPRSQIVNTADIPEKSSSFPNLQAEISGKCTASEAGRCCRTAAHRRQRTSRIAEHPAPRRGKHLAAKTPAVIPPACAAHPPQSTNSTERKHISPSRPLYDSRKLPVL